MTERFDPSRRRFLRQVIETTFDQRHLLVGGTEDNTLGFTIHRTRNLNHGIGQCVVEVASHDAVAVDGQLDQAIRFLLLFRDDREHAQRQPLLVVRVLAGSSNRVCLLVVFLRVRNRFFADINLSIVHGHGIAVLIRDRRFRAATVISGRIPVRAVPPGTGYDTCCEPGTRIATVPGRRVVVTVAVEATTNGGELTVADACTVVSGDCSAGGNHATCGITNRRYTTGSDGGIDTVRCCSHTTATDGDLAVTRSQGSSRTTGNRSIDSIRGADGAFASSIRLAVGSTNHNAACPKVRPQARP